MCLDVEWKKERTDKGVVFCFVCLAVCLFGWVGGLVGWFVGWLICLVCFFLVLFWFDLFWVGDGGGDAVSSKLFSLFR